MLLTSFYYDEAQRRFLTKTLNYNTEAGVLGYKTAFALLLLLVILYSLLVVCLILIIRNAKPPDV